MCVGLILKYLNTNWSLDTTLITPSKMELYSSVGSIETYYQAKVHMLKIFPPDPS